VLRTTGIAGIRNDHLYGLSLALHILIWASTDIPDAQAPAARLSRASVVHPVVAQCGDHGIVRVFDLARADVVVLGVDGCLAAGG